jgi:hypothetical protein
MLKRASANEMPVSEAPTITILAFLTIFASLSNLFVVKQRANGDSSSSSGLRSAPSTGTLYSLSPSSSSAIAF